MRALFSAALQAATQSQHRRVWTLTDVFRCHLSWIPRYGSIARKSGQDSTFQIKLGHRLHRGRCDEKGARFFAMRVVVNGTPQTNDVSLCAAISGVADIAWPLLRALTRLDCCRRCRAAALDAGVRTFRPPGDPHRSTPPALCRISRTSRRHRHDQVRRQGQSQHQGRQ